MDLELMFMSCFSIEKKPTDICELLKQAIIVALFQYPDELDKNKNRIEKMIMHTGISNYDEDDVILDDDDANEEEDNEEEVFKVEQEDPEKEKEGTQSENKISPTMGSSTTNQKKPILKIKVPIRRTLQAEKLDQCQKQNNSDPITGPTRMGSVMEMKKRSAEEQLDGDKEGSMKKMNVGIKREEVASLPEEQLISPQLKKLDEGKLTTKEKQSLTCFKKMESDTPKKREGGARQSHNTSAVNTGSRNVGIKRVEVASPPEKQLISPQLEELEEGELTTKEKQSLTCFKKMESNNQKKGEEGSRQIPTQSRNNVMRSAREHCISVLKKSMPLPLTKMNVAIKNVEFAPLHHKKQLSDCTPQKQRNCSAITRPIMQKPTQSMSDTQRFESSKRKFEERFAEQKEAKRRFVIVDFHDNHKPARDRCAPKRYWDRRRF